MRYVETNGCFAERRRLCCLRRRPMDHFGHQIVVSSMQYHTGRKDGVGMLLSAHNFQIRRKKRISIIAPLVATRILTMTPPPIESPNESTTYPPIIAPKTPRIILMIIPELWLCMINSAIHPAIRLIRMNPNVSMICSFPIARSLFRLFGSPLFWGPDLCQKQSWLLKVQKSTLLKI